jgi:anti-sigma regulatory factor (Ser/Thr protein kinase)
LASINLTTAPLTVSTNGNLLLQSPACYTRGMSEDNSSKQIFDTLNNLKDMQVCAYPIKELEEHIVADEFLLPLIQGLPQNVIDLLYYGITEILNNAIDHSEGDTVTVTICFPPDTVVIIVRDNGIGIFNNIQHTLNLESPRDAILELCKGKLTTDPTRHTGEGIFFTARACDEFVIISHNLQFAHVGVDDWLVEEERDLHEGTAVQMTVKVTSDRVLQEIFDLFSSESAEDEGTFGFTRTIIPISIAKYGPDGLVSRSKAKRVMGGIGKFKEVVLDFKGVESIGQAFADEIFRVFARRHPEVHIEAINTNEKVERMIKRAMSNNIEARVEEK